MSGGWGCKYDDDGQCEKNGGPCDPGKEGCVLEERMKKGKPDASRGEAAAEKPGGPKSEKG